MADELEISRTAAARRYIALHGAPLALVVTRQGAVEYVYRTGSFPFVRLSRGATAPQLPRRALGGDLTNHDEADPLDWLNRRTPSSLIVQTLRQRDDWATTLLFLETNDSDSDDQQAPHLGTPIDPNGCPDRTRRVRCSSDFLPCSVGENSLLSSVGNLPPTD